MLVRTRYILLLYLLIFSLFAYSEKSANRDSLQLICEQATKVSDHRRALEIAIELKKVAEKENNDRSLAYAYYFEGISNVLLGNGEDGRRQLAKAEELSHQINNDTLIIAIYNGYGG